MSNSSNDFYQPYYSKKFEYVKKMLSIFDYEKIIEEKKEDENVSDCDLIEKKSEMEDIKIDELNLSLRIQNCLKRSGFFTVSQLVEKIEDFIDDEEKGDQFLVEMRGCGDKGVIEIKEKLKSLGIKFGAESQGFDLNMIRKKRDKLRRELVEIKEREQYAEELLEKYDELLGENKKIQGGIIN